MLEARSTMDALPDVVQQEPETLPAWASRGALLNLNQAVREGLLDLTDVPEERAAAGQVAGQLYGVSLGSTAFVFVLDAELFARAGLALPGHEWTWEDFERLALALRDALDIYGAGGSLYHGQAFRAWLMGCGSTLYNREGTGLGFEDRAFLDFFAMLQRLREAGALPSLRTALSRASFGMQEALMVGREAAIGCVWSHLAQRLVGADPGRSLALRLPPRRQPDGPPVFMVRPSSFWTVAAHSEHPREAVQFIDFCVNSGEANQVLAAECGVPVSTAVRRGLNPLLEPFQRDMFAAVQLAESHVGPVLPPDPAESRSFLDDLFFRIAARVSDEAITPAQGLAAFKHHAMAQLAETLLAERRRSWMGAPWWSVEPPRERLEIPLVVAPYQGGKRPHAINPGPIPPNYVHTWAIDLNHVVDFKLNFSTLEQIALSWDTGDRLTVLNASGDVLQTFTSLADVQKKVITHQPSPFDVPPYHRIYLILETSEDEVERRFVLWSLRNTVVNQGTEEAILVEDDINYDATGPFVDSKTELYPPWYAASPHACKTSCDKPEESDGWYLLGKNVTDVEQGYYTLAYYNEIQGLLRLYLFNHSLTTVATTFQLEVSLQARQGNHYVDVEGAIFPIDPNPNHWSKATVVLPDLELHRWISVDIPMLYPMAKAFPALKNPGPANKPPNHWFSVYEEAFESGTRNMRLEISVRGHLVGQLAGTFEGVAIGEAIQKFYNPQSGTMAAATEVFEALKTGKDWYSAAKDFHGVLEDVYKEVKDQPGSKALGALVETGPAIWAGPLAYIGFALSLARILSQPDPLYLAIQLGLRGKLAGTLLTPLQPSRTHFYLPGRFSIQEAFSPAEGLPKNSRDRIDAVLPRYDRTLGLFGFQYNPGEVELDAYVYLIHAEEEYDVIYEYNAQFVYPAVDNPTLPPDWDDDYFLANASKKLRNLLPVIYNPYAEITPIKPREVGVQKIPKTYYVPHEQTYTYSYDVSYNSHLVCEPDDEQCLSAGPAEMTGPRCYIKVFDQAKDIGLSTDPAPDPSSPEYAAYHHGSYPTPNGVLLEVVLDDKCVPLTYRSFQKLEANLKNARPRKCYSVGYFCAPDSAADRFLPPDPFPLHDVMYYWDVYYLYYARSRKRQHWESPGGGPKYEVPKALGVTHLRSPVLIRFTGHLAKKEDKSLLMLYYGQMKSSLLSG